MKEGPQKSPEPHDPNATVELAERYVADVAHSVLCFLTHQVDQAQENARTRPCWASREKLAYWANLLQEALIHEASLSPDAADYAEDGAADHFWDEEAEVNPENQEALQQAQLKDESEWHRHFHDRDSSHGCF